MTETLGLAQALIARASVTPDDAGCIKLIAGRLAPLGFSQEIIDSGPPDGRVRNLWARRAPPNLPINPRTRTLVFAGHVDVVPPGPLEHWTSDPFTPTVRGGKLYGRGASDMKSSIAAFTVAVEEFLAARPDAPLAIAFLLTSDEEGPAVDGTTVVVERLRARGERPDWCIVGEPSAEQRTGDTLKNGRRGSLSGRLTVRGVQGHIAYPQVARNPIHQLAPALAELAAIDDWDQDRGNAYFPPTSWQVSNLHAGMGAPNVIPGEAVVDFNFRFGTASTPDALQARFEAVLQRHQLDYALQWTLAGLPFLTEPGPLVDAVQVAIRAETGQAAQLSTTGGTSDGRFMATLCPEVIELGPPNASIHQIDEHIALADLESLKAIYRRALDKLTDFAQAHPVA
ncbi:MAG: succinyl-diaminopimelate desuccinylase [Burkholderiaceae bacterium]|jgi:succinyl-diaminopimelate desuccinylase|nr:succinyl-diaminopimelate desuccinylase [Burkholderiaceae bacterium]